MTVDGSVRLVRPDIVFGMIVDLLFCNEEEAKSWSGSDSIEAASEALKLICKQFAITLGSKGALVFDGTNSFTIQSEKVKAVDTNGAGDMFAGAFLHAICEGHDFQKAGTFACLSAANVVSQFGPRLAIAQHATLLEKAKAEIFKK